MKILLINILIIIIFFTAYFTIQLAYGIPPQQVRMKVFRDGWAKVVEVYNLTGDYFLIHLPPYTEVIGVLLNGSPIEYKLNENIVYVEFNESVAYANITVIYFTPSYTEKIGNIWILNLNYTSSIIQVELPRNITIAGLNTIPQLITYHDNSILFVFSQGPIQIKYILRPIIEKQEEKSKIKPIEQPKENNNTIVSESAQKEQQYNQSQDSSSQNLSTPQNTTPSGNKSEMDAKEFPNTYLIITIVALISIIALIYFYHDRKQKQIYIRLSEGEAEILSILKDLGGKAYQSDVIRLSGIPKTTAWRYIKNLEKKGLIKILRKDRENFLVLK